ncbi:hypothetical protein PILCRDRAFT_669025 [Piloderma croceum F 1598]|uniref:Uncharacterized protein n=1 Tax=Piloderma croceum (strain F 1598) TaxID=765440 RepID=A0A0C3ET05_PILCF|nr:hypothetical protein PILCRDRAFT_669025 [Piloderma croceum F 1598]
MPALMMIFIRHWLPGLRQMAGGCSRHNAYTSCLPLLWKNCPSSTATITFRAFVDSGSYNSLQWAMRHMADATGTKWIIAPAQGWCFCSYAVYSYMLLPFSSSMLHRFLRHVSHTTIMDCHSSYKLFYRTAVLSYIPWYSAQLLSALNILG